MERPDNFIGVNLSSVSLTVSVLHPLKTQRMVFVTYWHGYINTVINQTTV